MSARAFAVLVKCLSRVYIMLVANSQKVIRYDNRRVGKERIASRRNALS